MTLQTEYFINILLHYERDTFQLLEQRGNVWSSKYLALSGWLNVGVTGVTDYIIDLLHGTLRN